MSKHALATILFIGGLDADNVALASTLRDAGFRVTEALTGEQAFDLAREGPELIILGAGLPDEGGPDLGLRVKAVPAMAAVPLLHLDGCSAEGASRNGYADGYLRGPVGPQELLTYVRALLRLGQAEAARQASDNRLRDILDHAPVIVHVKDLEGKYRLVNRHWEVLFHLGREQVCGKGPHDVHPADQAEALLANDRLVLQTGAPLEFEEVVLQDDGVHTYLSVKFPLADASGRPSGVCGISADITRRKRAEEALRDSEALYHSLVEGLPVCLIRKDLRGRFTFANRAFCVALKKSLSDVVGKTDHDFYPADLAGKYQLDDRRVIELGEVFEDVEEHQDPEGAATYVQVLKAPLRDSRGEIIGMQGAYWDITARRRAEAEVGQTAAEFRVARRIQQRLFPRSLPFLPGLDIAVASFGFDIGGASYPAEAIGGDYYDFVPLSDGSLGIAIGDVSGHGVGPALLMAEVRAFLRAFAQTNAEVGEVLGLVNRALLPDVEDDRFVTLLLARLDPRTRRFSYASAGQQPGYVLDAAGQVRQVLGSTGPPLGIFPENACPTSEEIVLGEGDLVLLLTDGVADASAPDGTRFGVQRALDLVRARRHEAAWEIVQDLYHAVRAFGHNLAQYDDITATVIKVSGPARQAGGAALSKAPGPSGAQ